MTLEQQEYINRELDDAIATGDAMRVNAAQCHALKALCDCQRKTSDRVKKMEIEDDRKAHERKGAKWAVTALASIASVVGPVAAIKICKMIGILW